MTNPGPSVQSILTVVGPYRVAALEAAGFEVVPTFRTPHVTIAFTGELEDGLERFRRAVHEGRPNPYHGTQGPMR